MRWKKRNNFCRGLDIQVSKLWNLISNLYCNETADTPILPTIEESVQETKKTDKKFAHQYEQHVLDEGTKEGIRNARSVRKQAEMELEAAIAAKAAYEKRY